MQLNISSSSTFSKTSIPNSSHLVKLLLLNPIKQTLRQPQHLKTRPIINPTKNIPRLHKLLKITNLRFKPLLKNRNTPLNRYGGNVGEAKGDGAEKCGGGGGALEVGGGGCGGVEGVEGEGGRVEGGEVGVQDFAVGDEPREVDGGT